MAVGIGDPAEFKNILVSLCKEKDLEAMSRHAYAYAMDHFNMERAVEKMYCLIFGEEA